MTAKTLNEEPSPSSTPIQETSTDVELVEIQLGQKDDSSDEKQMTHPSIDLDEILDEDDDLFNEESTKTKSQLFRECCLNKKTLTRLMLITVVLVIFVVCAIIFPIEDYLDYFLKMMNDLGWLGPIFFTIIYIIANIAFIPCTILNICAGFIWGLWLGSLVVWVGGLLGCLAAFIIGRTCFKYWAEFFTKNFRMAAILDRIISKNGWKIMILLRLSPIMPYNILNYTLALVSSITYLSYSVTTAIGMIPGSVMYVYFGSIARNINDAVKGESRTSTLQFVLIGVGLVLTSLVVVAISILSAREIKKEMRAQRDIPTHKRKSISTRPSTDDLESQIVQPISESSELPVTSEGAMLIGNKRKKSRSEPGDITIEVVS